MGSDWEILRSELSRTAVVLGRRRLGAISRGWYIDSMRLLHSPQAVALAGRVLRDLMQDLAFDCVAGIDRSGMPVALGLADAARHDGVELEVVNLSPSRRRPENLIRASPWAGEKLRQAVIVDDTINSGSTARRALRQLVALGGEAVAVACLVQYTTHRPPLLAGYKGQLRTAYHLRDLGLRRFMLPRSRSSRQPEPGTDTPER